MGPAHRRRHANGGGFTFIELTIVVLIVAILATLLAPMLHGNSNAAKWTEGRNGAGTLATGIRTYCVETGNGHPGVPPGGDFTDFRVFEVELTGKYFRPANYSVSAVTYDRDSGNISYLITVSTPASLVGPDKTLDQNGRWSDSN